MHTGAPLIAALIVMMVSLAGSIFARGRLGEWMNKYLTYLATFSGGVFLVIAYFLAEEAVHEGGWIVGLGSVLLGAAIMEGVRFLFPNKHHHHGPHDHTHSPIDGRQVLLSDALHNIGDGILLVGAFAADFYVGVAATVGVVLHETVQEISEYFVLRGVGYTNGQALARNFVVSAAILIGLVFATYLSSIPFVLSILSGIAAGGFLSVVLHDLIPHAIASVRTNGGLYVHVLVALLGAFAMLGVQALVPHESEEEHLSAEAVVIETQAASPQVIDVASESALETNERPVETSLVEEQVVSQETNPVETAPAEESSSGEMPSADGTAPDGTNPNSDKPIDPQ